MNRRSLLAAGTAGVLLGVSGCLGDLESLAGSTEEDVPGCTQAVDWEDDITSGPADPDPESIAGHRNCANADRPEPTGDVCETFELEKPNGEIDELHSVGIKPYPEPPTAFDEESLTQYVYEYERAYSQNEAVSKYGERAIGAGADITEDSTRVLEMYDEITVIGISFAAAVEFKRRGGGFTGDDNFSDAAVYGVDETGIVRVRGDYLDRTGTVVEDAPDPVEDGDLLQCF